MRDARMQPGERRGIRIRIVISEAAAMFQDEQQQRNIKQHRHILMTARNTALRENQMVFDCITGIGIKRLSDSEIVSMESVRPMARVRSALRNGVKRITCAQNITNEERIRVNASLSMFSVLAEFSKNKSLDKLEPLSADLVPFGKVLKMFE